MRIYIDTSVVNGLYCNDSGIKTETIRFFKDVRIFNYTLYGSEATIEEIENTPQEPKKKLLKNVITEYDVEILPTTDEIRILANKYVNAGIIPKKYSPDAFHIAVAAIYNIPVLASWNFEHIVKIKTKLEINRINRQEGYALVEISSPKEI